MLNFEPIKTSCKILALTTAAFAITACGAADKASEAANAAKDKAAEAAASTTDAVKDKAGDAMELADGAKDAMMDKAEGAKDAMMDKAEGAKDAMMDKADGAKDAMMDKAEGAKDAMMDKAEGAKDAMASKGVAVSGGTFSGRSDHITTGGVSVVKTADGYAIQLASDFSLDGAPDPVVALGNNGEYNAANKIGVLSSNTGAQTYPIPAGMNPADFSEAYIWCEKFNVPLGIAPLKATSYGS